MSRKEDKIETEDLIFVIRKDRKKYARAIELLVADEKFKAVKKSVKGATGPL